MMRVMQWVPSRRGRRAAMMSTPGDSTSLWDSAGVAWFKGRDARLLALAVLTGVTVGLVVAGFEFCVELVHHALEDQHIAVVAIAPFAGLVVTAAVLRWVGGGATPSTSDEYVRAFHERAPKLPLRDLPAKLLGGVATVGSGGALGLEGPAILTGSTLGLAIQERLGRFLGRNDSKILLTAGAAAGVAAVFRTPATGVLFALESPYIDDVTRRALLPTLIASATSYVTFVRVLGLDLDPVLFIRGTTSPTDFVVWRDLFGALVIGVLAGLGARLFAKAVAKAKGLGSMPLLPRLLAAGVALATLAVVSNRLFGEPLTIGPGGAAVEWLNDERTFQLLVVLFVMRVVATLVTLGAGGAGGLFIPLAVLGTILGRAVGGLLGRPLQVLFPTLGLAAFLGAGYRTPLASTMFVAETVGGVDVVVPAVLAAAVSQLMMGGRSVSKHQQGRRQGHLERRFALSVTSVLSVDVLTVPSDATVEEFVQVHAVGRRERTVPVVDDGTYVGLCGLDEALAVDRAEWDTTTVADVMRVDVKTGLPSWTLRNAIKAMDHHTVDLLPIADRGGVFIGVVTDDSIVRLDEILDETDGEL